MTADDLRELDGLLSLASDVVNLREVQPRRALCRGDVIALRHDVDANAGALDAAVRLAAWERARGYRSTYFVLHTAPYWTERETPAKLSQIAALGHEIGLHVNAIPAAIASGRTPEEEIRAALSTLRSWGHVVAGVAPHGDELCYHRGKLVFVNDEVFSECARPELGAPDRVVFLSEVRPVRLDPKPLLDYYALNYEAYRLPRGAYLSDSGDSWTPSIAQARAAFESGLDAPLQVLVHPDWYTKAL